MHARTTACAALLALAALTTGCSSQSSDEPDKPTSTTATATATPAADSAADRQACVDASKAAVEADNDDTKPAECEGLTESDYLDAYMDGLEQHNQEGRDALQDAIDEASEAAQP
jgi:hypothetical protein